jgi:SAM-dependent methyltransferase
MRRLVGREETSAFDNPSGGLIGPELPAACYEAVFDFGCGCGRHARQLIQQDLRPRRYVGIDLHRGMIAWCRQHLAPMAPGFEFHHHDVYNVGLNPEAPEDRRWLPFPVEDDAFTLVIGWSIFTHLVQEQAEAYMAEVGRVLRADGLFHGTFFTFDRAGFPMLQDAQNALYVNHVDPTNAVIFDRGWIRATAAAAGLKPVRIVAPTLRGFHWHVTLAALDSPLEECEWPPDAAAPGSRPPPLLHPGAERLGLEA